MKLTLLAMMAVTAATNAMEDPMSLDNTDGKWRQDAWAGDEFTSTAAPGKREKVDFNKWLPGFYDTTTCTADNFDSCVPLWYGTQPVVISPANGRRKDDHLELRYMDTTNSDSVLLDEASASSDGGEGEDCDCGYNDKKTGLVRSVGLHRGGHFEVKVTVDSTEHQFAVWFQSQHVELSAINMANGKLWSMGYIFNETAVESNSKMEVDFPYTPGTDVVFGFTWKNNDDLDVYVNGNLMYTLLGANWNPMGMYQGIWAEECNLMIDIQAPTTAEPLLLGAATAMVDYLRVWELDCMRMQTLGRRRPNPRTNEFFGVKGLTSDCTTTAPYNEMCNSFDEQNLCINTHPGAAMGLTLFSDAECDMINDPKFCGGKFDYAGHMMGAFTTNKFRGSVGQCWWDETGKSAPLTPNEIDGVFATGQCRPKPPPEYRVFDVALRNQCGGTNDVTNMHGMWCFNQCVPRTLLNMGVDNPSRVLCGKAVDRNYEDMCVGFGKSNYTIGLHPRTGNDAIIASEHDCTQIIDFAAKRGKHCTYRFRSTPPWNLEDGTNLRGFVCLSKTPNEEKAAKGAYFAYEYKTREQCEYAGYFWGCHPKKSGANLFSCRKNKDQFVTDDQCNI